MVRRAHNIFLNVEIKFGILRMVMRPVPSGYESLHTLKSFNNTFEVRGKELAWLASP